MNAVAQHGDVTVIELGLAYDSLDDTALEELGGFLLTHAATADPPYLVLDLSETVFVGSLFIEILVRAWKRLTERGGAFALCGVQPFCDEVLKTSRLDSLWTSFPTREQALRSLRTTLAGSQERLPTPRDVGNAGKLGGLRKDPSKR